MFHAKLIFWYQKSQCFQNIAKKVGLRLRAEVLMALKKIAAINRFKTASVNFFNRLIGLPSISFYLQEDYDFIFFIYYFD